MSAPRDDRPVATRSVVRSRNGMVATAQPLATIAGLRALRAGGTAVDAALAANAALTAVEPTSCGLGGDLFAMVWDPASRSLAGLDASGRCPMALDLSRVRADADGTIPLRSPQSWTVPGCVSGWFALHARYGRLAASDILGDAIRLAREGFPVTEVIASAWGRSARAHADAAGFAEVFLPSGRAPREGEIFANRALARTLEPLTEGGPDAFYHAESAAEIVAFSEAHGGAFAHRDFEAHRSDWITPLATSFEGHELHELPPAGQGLAAIQMLDIAEALGIGSLDRGDPDWWHVLIEAKKLAFLDRARCYADPAFTSVDIAALASKERASELAARVDMRRATVHPSDDARLGAAETTYLATADADGMMVSLIQSNYTGFGSGHAIPSLGFSLQNRGALFALDPRHPNVLAPGKRPFHTIIPAFVTRGGEPWMAFGVMGGDMQPQGHVQVLCNLLVAGMNLQAAGDAPRFCHSGSPTPTGLAGEADGGVVMLEPDVPDSVREELASRGHRLGDTPFAYGGYQSVAKDAATGCWLGATESRKDGCAAGW